MAVDTKVYIKKNEAFSKVICTVESQTITNLKVVEGGKALTTEQIEAHGISVNYITPDKNTTVFLSGLWTPLSNESDNTAWKLSMTTDVGDLAYDIVFYKGTRFSIDYHIDTNGTTVQYFDTNIDASPKTVNTLGSDDNSVLKDGYTFQHWIDGDGNTFDGGSPITLYPDTPVVLTAVYEADVVYTLKFVSDKTVKDDEAFDSEITATPVNGSHIFTLPTLTTTKDGAYSFAGWLNQFGRLYTSGEYTIQSPVSTVETLTASWLGGYITPKLTLVFGGTTEVFETSVDVTENGKKYRVYTLPSRTVDGYEFVRWSSTDDGSTTYYNAGDTVRLEYDRENENSLTLDAELIEVRNLIVTYKGDEGNTLYTDSKELTTETTARFTIRDALSKFGNDFEYWADESGNKYYAGTSVEIAGSVVLTPKWNNRYWINHGSISITPGTYNYGTIGNGITFPYPTADNKSPYIVLDGTTSDGKNGLPISVEFVSERNEYELLLFGEVKNTLSPDYVRVDVRYIDSEGDGNIHLYRHYFSPVVQTQTNTYILKYTFSDGTNTYTKSVSETSTSDTVEIAVSSFNAISHDTSISVPADKEFAYWESESGIRYNAGDKIALSTSGGNNTITVPLTAVFADLVKYRISYDVATNPNVNTNGSISDETKMGTRSRGPTTTMATPLILSKGYLFSGWEIDSSLTFTSGGSIGGIDDSRVGRYYTTTVENGETIYCITLKAVYVAGKESQIDLGSFYAKANEPIGIVLLTDSTDTRKFIAVSENDTVYSSNFITGMKYSSDTTKLDATTVYSYAFISGIPTLNDGETSRYYKVWLKHDTSEGGSSELVQYFATVVVYSDTESTEMTYHIIYDLGELGGAGFSKDDLEPFASDYTITSVGEKTVVVAKGMSLQATSCEFPVKRITDYRRQVSDGVYKSIVRWNSAEDGSGTNYEEDIDSVTLVYPSPMSRFIYAVWDYKTEVVLECLDSKGNVDTSVNWNNADKSMSVLGQYGTMVTFNLPVTNVVKDGYALKGWKDESGKIHSGTYQIVADGRNRKLTAVWTEVAYIVEFLILSTPFASAGGNGKEIAQAFAELIATKSGINLIDIGLLNIRYNLTASNSDRYYGGLIQYDNDGAETDINGNSVVLITENGVACYRIRFRVKKSKDRLDVVHLPFGEMDGIFTGTIDNRWVCAKNNKISAYVADYTVSNPTYGRIFVVEYSDSSNDIFYRYTCKPTYRWKDDNGQYGKGTCASATDNNILSDTVDARLSEITTLVFEVDSTDLPDEPLSIALFKEGEYHNGATPYTTLNTIFDGGSVTLPTMESDSTINTLGKIIHIHSTSDWGYCYDTVSKVLNGGTTIAVVGSPSRVNKSNSLVYRSEIKDNEIKGGAHLEEIAHPVVSYELDVVLHDTLDCTYQFENGEVRRFDVVSTNGDNDDGLRFTIDAPVLDLADIPVEITYPSTDGKTVKDSYLPIFVGWSTKEIATDGSVPPLYENLDDVELSSPVVFTDNSNYEMWAVWVGRTPVLIEYVVGGEIVSTDSVLIASDYATNLNRRVSFTASKSSAQKEVQAWRTDANVGSTTAKLYSKGRTYSISAKTVEGVTSLYTSQGDKVGTRTIDGKTYPVLTFYGTTTDELDKLVGAAYIDWWTEVKIEFASDEERDEFLADNDVVTGKKSGKSKNSYFKHHRFYFDNYKGYSKTISSNISTSPIMTQPAESTIAMDISGVSAKITIPFTKVAPAVPDDDGDDSRKWSLSKWKYEFVNIANDWQNLHWSPITTNGITEWHMAGGYVLTVYPPSVDGDDVANYISTMPLVKENVFWTGTFRVSYGDRIINGSAILDLGSMHPARLGDYRMKSGNSVLQVLDGDKKEVVTIRSQMLNGIEVFSVPLYSVVGSDVTAWQYTASDGTTAFATQSSTINVNDMMPQSINGNPTSEYRIEAVIKYPEYITLIEPTYLGGGDEGIRNIPPELHWYINLEGIRQTVCGETGSDLYVDGWIVGGGAGGSGGDASNKVSANAGDVTRIPLTKLTTNGRSSKHDCIIVNLGSGGKGRQQDIDEQGAVGGSPTYLFIATHDFNNVLKYPIKYMAKGGNTSSEEAVDYYEDKVKYSADCTVTNGHCGSSTAGTGFGGFAWKSDYNFSDSSKDLYSKLDGDGSTSKVSENDWENYGYLRRMYFGSRTTGNLASGGDASGLGMLLKCNQNKQISSACAILPYGLWSSAGYDERALALWSRTEWTEHPEFMDKWNATLYNKLIDGSSKSNASMVLNNASVPLDGNELPCTSDGTVTDSTFSDLNLTLTTKDGKKYGYYTTNLLQMCHDSAVSRWYNTVEIAGSDRYDEDRGTYNSIGNAETTKSIYGYNFETGWFNNVWMQSFGGAGNDRTKNGNGYVSLDWVKQYVDGSATSKGLNITSNRKDGEDRIGFAGTNGEDFKICKDYPSAGVFGGAGGSTKRSDRRSWVEVYEGDNRVNQSGNGGGGVAILRWWTDNKNVEFTDSEIHIPSEYARYGTDSITKLNAGYVGLHMGASNRVRYGGYLKFQYTADVVDERGATSQSTYTVWLDLGTVTKIDESLSKNVASKTKIVSKDARYNYFLDTSTTRSLSIEFTRNWDVAENEKAFRIAEAIRNNVDANSPNGKDWIEYCDYGLSMLYGDKLDGVDVYLPDLPEKDCIIDTRMLCNAVWAKLFEKTNDRWQMKFDGADLYIYPYPKDHLLGDLENITFKSTKKYHVYVGSATYTYNNKESLCDVVSGTLSLTVGRQLRKVKNI